MSEQNQTVNENPENFEFDMSQLDPELGFKKLLNDLVQDGKVKNVTVNDDEMYEARCVVYNKENFELTEITVEDNVSTQSVNFETDAIMWLMAYENYKLLYVQNGAEFKDFINVSNGELDGYYHGDNYAYLLNFLSGLGSNNFNLDNQEVKEKFVKVESIVNSVVGSRFSPIKQLLINMLVHVDAPENQLVEWDKAEDLTQLGEYVYGSVAETDDTKYIKYVNTRAAVWFNPSVIDSDGNVQSDPVQQLATNFVNVNAMPSMSINSVCNFTVTEKISDHMLAIMLIKEDMMTGKLAEIKQYCKTGFDPEKTVL